MCLGAGQYWHQTQRGDECFKRQLAKPCAQPKDLTDEVERLKKDRYFGLERTIPSGVA
jgi:hypothetical protein